MSVYLSQDTSCMQITGNRDPMHECVSHTGYLMHGKNNGVSHEEEADTRKIAKDGQEI